MSWPSEELTAAQAPRQRRLGNFTLRRSASARDLSAETPDGLPHSLSRSWRAAPAQFDRHLRRRRGVGLRGSRRPAPRRSDLGSAMRLRVLKRNHLRTIPAVPARRRKRFPSPQAMAWILVAGAGSPRRAFSCGHAPRCRKTSSSANRDVPRRPGIIGNGLLQRLTDGGIRPTP